MRRWDNDELKPDEKSLVHEFLLTILPPTKNKRRGRNNELSTIAAALDRWFMRNFRFHVGITALWELFEELEQEGYNVRPMGEEYDPETKTSRAVPVNEEYRGEKPYLEHKATFLYVNVHPTRVKQIRGLTYNRPSNTSVDKLIDTGPIQEELRTFLIKHLGA